MESKWPAKNSPDKSKHVRNRKVRQLGTLVSPWIQSIVVMVLEFQQCMTKGNQVILSTNQLQHPQSSYTYNWHKIIMNTNITHNHKEYKYQTLSELLSYLVHLQVYRWVNLPDGVCGGELSHGNITGRLVSHQGVLGSCLPVVAGGKFCKIPGKKLKPILWVSFHDVWENRRQKSHNK